MWVGDVDLCNGVNVADVLYMIEFLFSGGPPLCSGTMDCDFALFDDTVEIQVSSGGSMVQMDLYVRNSQTVVGASMGFSWDDPNLQLDSVVATPLVDTAFDYGPYFYEQDNLDTTNANRRCLFGVSRYSQSLPGIPGNAGLRRLWASYYFTSTAKSPLDEVTIDTTQFSDGSAYQVVVQDGDSTAGHSPAFARGQYACCGLYTGGFTGNTNCDTEGKRNLADITRLTDRVYIRPDVPLCCEDNGNTNGDEQGVLNLADITRLTDKVYIRPWTECEPCP
jgi:hypothetical protein